MSADLLVAAFGFVLFGLMDPWTWAGVAVGMIAGAFRAPWKVFLGAVLVFIPLRLAGWIAITNQPEWWVLFGLTLASAATILATFAVARALVR
jgi:hypothetical protein